MNIVYFCTLFNCSSLVQCFPSMLETLDFLFNIINNNSNNIKVIFFMPILWNIVYTSRLFLKSPLKVLVHSVSVAKYI